jgi:hypothetical protein
VVCGYGQPVSWDPQDVVYELTDALEVMEHWQKTAEQGGRLKVARAYEDCVIAVRVALYGPSAMPPEPWTAPPQAGDRAIR